MAKSINKSSRVVRDETRKGQKENRWTERGVYVVWHFICIETRVSGFLSTRLTHDKIRHPALFWPVLYTWIYSNWALNRMGIRGRCQQVI